MGTLTKITTFLVVFTLSQLLYFVIAVKTLAFFDRLELSVEIFPSSSSSVAATYPLLQFSFFSSVVLVFPCYSLSSREIFKKM